MTEQLTAVVNARLPGRDGLYRLEISQGRFGEITQQAATMTPESGQLDAGANLVSPALVEPHIHLDAALTAGEPRWNQSGTLFEGIECWAERKAMLNQEDVTHRAIETLKLFAAHGIQYVRTHVDVTDPELTALKAMLAVRVEHVAHHVAHGTLGVFVWV